MSLFALGWDDGFADVAAPLLDEGQVIARVIAVDRDRYVIHDGSQTLSATLLGKFIYEAASTAHYPCVGDWVVFEQHGADLFTTIGAVLPRRSQLSRKHAGKDMSAQMIAANIDVAFIVQSCHFDFNLNRLERYLVMVNEGQISPNILLTKTDLVSDEVLDEMVENIRSASISIPILMLSQITGQGLAELRALMKPQKTYCLLGSSGVGKTTIINQLLGNTKLETQTVSLSGEGRHTTTRRQLISLADGAMLIDMPGMREFGMLEASDGLQESFEDVAALMGSCKFSDCGHTDEPGCAVLKALASGELNEAHYQHYLKLQHESEFFGMSALEKRRKDKDFGKMIKTVMSSNRKRK